MSTSSVFGMRMRTGWLTKAEEPALIRKILAHVRAREEPAVFWRQQSGIGTGMARIEGETLVGLGLLVSA